VSAPAGYVADASAVSAVTPASVVVLIFTVVPEIELIVVLAGIPVPVMVMPGTKPEVSEIVMDVAPEAAVAARPAIDAEVKATVVPANVFSDAAKFDADVVDVVPEL